MTILVIVFLVSFATILLCAGLASSYFKSKQKKQIRSLLRSADAIPAGQRDSNLLRPEDRNDGFAKLLRHFKLAEKLDLILEQSGQNWTGSKLIVVSGAAAAGSFLLGLKLHLLGSDLSGPAFGVLGAVSPLLFVLRKRGKNLAAFEKQLPEALDFLSRSMRAGHGLSIAMEMLAADSPDPLGGAFRHVSNDLQLGSSLEVALSKLLVLFPMVDVRFFVSSVLLQQETGGNLSEILNKLSHIIRERFRLKGQVKAASAHGRITGLVLLLMPVAVAGIMMITSPQYLIDLAADAVGRKLIYGAIAGQIVGYFVIQKIINIKV